ncbi:MAG: phosphatase [Gammaproteobacteria bacterium]
MSQHYEKHAQQVVDNFRSLLDANSAETVGDEKFDELAMLIESAISTSVTQELETAADILAKTAQDMRARAERFD